LVTIRSNGIRGETDVEVSSDERQLVIQAKRGDTAAFEMLVSNHASYVYNVALRILGNTEEAEDLAQEAFVRAWKALPRFRVEARFRTWLYRIVTNLCYDKLPQIRRELSQIEVDGNLPMSDERGQPEAGLLSAELRDKLHAAIDELPDGYRLLITLRHLQEMSYAEIAEATNQPLGTVKTGIYRARRLLRTAIQEYEADHG
jgi:RNA polymerase sigma-70 factor (ECF subfamily)